MLPINPIFVIQLLYSMFIVFILFHVYDVYFHVYSIIFHVYVQFYSMFIQLYSMVMQLYSMVIQLHSMILIQLYSIIFAIQLYSIIICYTIIFHYICIPCISPNLKLNNNWFCLLSKIPIILQNSRVYFHPSKAAGVLYTNNTLNATHLYTKTKHFFY